MTSLNALSTILDGILAGDESQLHKLTQLAGNEDDAKDLTQLCEKIALLALQNEATHLRLETIIEDLLQAQSAVDEANHDPLTGLPNRTIFHQTLDTACNNKATRVALMFVDLDHFKQVNDTLGHDAGDEILQLVTARMLREIRSQDTLARLGGDEFAVILPGVVSDDEVKKIADRIVETLVQPFSLQHNHIAHIGASIGISFYPDEAETPIQLLKNADIAMYTAKDAGRNRAVMFNKND